MIYIYFPYFVFIFLWDMYEGFLYLSLFYQREIPELVYFLLGEQIELSVDR